MPLPDNENRITREIAVTVFRFDKTKRTLVWRKIPHTRSSARVGETCGSLTKDGYLHICFKGKKYLAHRLSFFLAYGFWPRWNLDHIDGDKLNNHPRNLRPCKEPGNWDQNPENLKQAKSNNKLGILGVFVSKHMKGKRKQYKAKLQVKGVVKELGYFETATEAYATYISEKRKYHEFNTL